MLQTRYSTREGTYIKPLLMALVIGGIVLSLGVSHAHTENTERAVTYEQSELISPLFETENQKVTIVLGESLYDQEQRRLAEERKKKEEEERKKKLTRQVGNATLCSCVLFAKAKSGIDVGSIGFAKNHPINSQTPTVGAIIVTSESSGYIYTGHVGVVTGFDGTYVYINDANYERCRETNRKLPLNSPLVRGYYN